MRKILLAIIFSMFATSALASSPITVDSIVSADDLTISWLNTFKNKVVDAINSFPGSNIQTASITHVALDSNADPVNRWDEAFNDFVYTGLLPTTATGLTGTIPAGTAYVSGMRVVKADTSHTFTATKDTYIDLSKNGVFTYSEVAVSGAAPTTAANSIRLCKVRTNATDITAVEDLRVTSVNLSSIYEDFTIRGYNLTCITTDDTLSIDPGVLYNGSYRVAKTSTVGLHLDTATDWWDGVVDTYTSPDWCYVGCDNTGNIRFLGNNPGNRADTSGNTAGILRYYYDGTKYWRLIGAVSVDATNNISFGFNQYGSEVTFHSQMQDVYGTTSAAWSTLELTNVPATSRIAKITLLQTSGGSEWITVRESGRTNSQGISVSSLLSVGGITGRGGTYVEVSTNSSQQIDWTDRATAGSTLIWTVGYIDNTRD